jgi:predicted nucleic acid-binding protein
MMRVLLDTNILLDVVLERQPFSEQSRAVLQLLELKQFTGLICANSVTTVFYVIRKVIGTPRAMLAIQSLLSLCEVAPVTHSVLERASVTQFSDFEDAVIHESALQAAATVIVTRDINDYKTATLAIYRPEELVRLLSVNP